MKSVEQQRFLLHRDAVRWAETGSLGAERESCSLRGGRFPPSETQNGSEETFKRVQSLVNSHKETEGGFHSEPLRMAAF